MFKQFSGTKGQSPQVAALFDYEVKQVLFRLGWFRPALVIALVTGFVRAC